MTRFDVTFHFKRPPELTYTVEAETAQSAITTARRALRRDQYREKPTSVTIRDESAAIRSGS